MPVASSEELEKIKEKVFFNLRKLTISHSFLINEKNSILENSEIQAFLKLKNESKIEQAIYSFIINECFTAEKIAPGSFLETLNCLLNSSIQETKESFFPSEKDINSAIEDCEDSVLKCLIKDAILLAGFRGKIAVEKSANNFFSLELVDSQDFSCKSFVKNTIKLENARILCIDGYVENVSELNKVFLDAVETKDQLVIFSAGFNDDVISTIEHNKKRGTMFIIPVVIPFDIANINTLADVSVTAGCQLISSHFGKLISNIDFSDSSRVEEILVSENFVSIKNHKSQHEVNKHVKNLIKKSEEADSHLLYEDRIKKLIKKKVVIKIPDDKNYVKRASQVDYCLRTFKSILDFGVCENGDSFSKHYVSKIFSKKIKENLQNLGSVIVKK